jgi:hypothetical protein
MRGDVAGGDAGGEAAVAPRGGASSPSHAPRMRVRMTATANSLVMRAPFRIAVRLRSGAGDEKSLPILALLNTLPDRG